MTVDPKRIMSLIAILAAAYLAWAAFLFVMQRGMMFPVRLVAGDGAGAPPAGVERIWFDTSDGRVEAWFLPAPGPGPAPSAIFAHGNAERIDGVLPEALDLHELGLSVLLVEYPGYGRSEGRPSRASIGAVFMDAYDWLAARPDVDAERIVGIGRSLGGGAITDLSLARPLRAMVLQSTFTSVAAFARRYLLPAFIARDRFDNLAALRRFHGPVLVVHGTNDEIIPFAHGERLARSATAAELMALECGHNDCPPDRIQYLAGLEDFLARAGLLHTK